MHVNMGQITLGGFRRGRTAVIDHSLKSPVCSICDAIVRNRENSPQVGQRVTSSARLGRK